MAFRFFSLFFLFCLFGKTALLRRAWQERHKIVNQVVWVKEIVNDAHQVVRLSAAKRTAYSRDAIRARRNSGEAQFGWHNSANKG